MDSIFAKIDRFKQKLEWFPILIVRLLMGSFLIVSGFFKLIDKDQHQILLKGLTEAGFEWATFYAYILPLVIMVCGVFLAIGFLTSLSSATLFVLTISSLIVINRVDGLTQYKGASLTENLLYLPEMLYALIFFWLFFSGPGKISVDYKRKQDRKSPQPPSFRTN